MAWQAEADHAGVLPVHGARFHHKMHCTTPPDGAGCAPALSCAVARFRIGGRGHPGTRWQAIAGGARALA
ncbi:hypothetical protein BFX83_06835 [Komagataeibacter xylinus]|nr:hypothetical protein BFX83_06835 [Komagataeibacter xylinus]